MPEKRVRVTSHDIARMAGVSRSTVSRVLNNVESALISPATRTRVLEAATQLGYTPNASARSLRNGHAQSIGLILPSDAHYLVGTHAFVQFLVGITEVTDAMEYSLIIGSSTFSASPWQMLQANQADGIVILHPSDDPTMFEHLAPYTNQVVLMNAAPPMTSLSWVDVDNLQGARAAAEHLIRQGHQRIGFLTGRPGSLVAGLRFAGYREALATAGIEFDPTLVITAEEPLLPPEGYTALQRLLDLSPRPSAVFCYRDLLAYGVVRAALDRGMHVPTDLAVVGFDDEPSSAYQPTPLTTVHADFQAKGRIAAETLMALLSGKGISPIQHMLPATLIVRASS